MQHLGLDHVNVPQAARPLLWRQGRSVVENVYAIRNAMDRNRRWLPMDEDHFDEAAILVPNQEELLGLCASLRGAGWVEFNSAGDTVYANPFGNRYTVDYLFYQHEMHAWRLEVMLLGEGFSPLHAGLLALAPADGYPVAHLSFKPTRQRKADQPQRTYARTVDWLRNNGAIHAQTCQSTYGSFSYWLPYDAPEQLYVKPRVNMRDEGAA